MILDLALGLVVASFLLLKLEDVRHEEDRQRASQREGEP